MSRNPLAVIIAATLLVTACSEQEVTQPAADVGDPSELSALLDWQPDHLISMVPSCTQIPEISQEIRMVSANLSNVTSGEPGPVTNLPGTHVLLAPSGQTAVTAVVGGLLPAIDISGGLRPSEAQDVNIHETFVGYSGPAGLPQAAVRYQGDASWTTLSLSGSPTWSIAYSVNDSDQIAGTKGGPNLFQIPQAFVHSGGSEIVLPLPSGFNRSGAFAINNYGQVAGYLVPTPGGPTSAALWTPTTPNGSTYTVAIIVAGVPLNPAAAYGLNEAGQVVGGILDVISRSNRNAGASGMFVWTPASPNATTGTHVNHGTPPNTISADGRDINDLGEVVGNAFHETQRASQQDPTLKDVNLAFHWEAGSGFTVIPPPVGGRAGGGITSHAYAINNQGTVVGRVATEFTFFEQRMFLWHKADGVMEVYEKLQNTCSSAGFGINECGVVAGWNLDPEAPAGENTYAGKWGTCAIDVTKTAPQATVMSGDTARFTIKVSNGSTRSVQNVSMEDVLPSGPGISWSIDGSSTECSISGTSPQTVQCVFDEIGRGGSYREVTVGTATADESCQGYDNTATASALGRRPGEGSASLEIECPPRLQASKSAATADERGSDVIGYTMQLTNAGRGAAIDATLRDTLPVHPDLSWRIASQPGSGPCTIASGVLTCNFGSLPADDVRRVTVSSPTVANGGCTEYDNTAWFGAANHERLSASATASVGCVPEIELLKTAAATTVEPGNPIGFTIQVNVKGTTEAKNTTLTDSLPGGLGIEWQIGAPANSACGITGTSPQVLSCNFGTLPGGASRTVAVTAATVNASCGVYDNSASVTAEGLPAPIGASASLTVPCESVPEAGECEGGVTAMVVKNITGAPLAGEARGQRVAPGKGPVLAAQTMGVGLNTLYTYAITSVGGVFEPVANDRLANEFSVLVGGTKVDQVHMSCSVPLYPGMRIGDEFEVVELSFVGAGNDKDKDKGKDGK